jgi:hypothetical protein
MMLKGLVSGVSVIASEPHSYITVRTVDQDHWAIQGDSREVLVKAGWTFSGMIKLGHVIEVVAYRQRPTILLTGLPICAPWVREVVKAGCLALGIEITLADGRRLPYGRRQ